MEKHSGMIGGGCLHLCWRRGWLDGMLLFKVTWTPMEMIRNHQHYVALCCAAAIN